MRHSNFRVRKDGNDGSPLFASDATFCAQAGQYGSGTVTLASLNIGGHHVRHYAAEVWIASNGGPHAYDSPSNDDADVSWNVTDPWMP